MKKIAVCLLIAFCFSFCSCNGLFEKARENIGTHTVRFESNEGTPVSPQEIGMLTEVPQTTRDGHVFCGWFLDQELKTPVTYPMRVKKDITLYAKWTRDTDQLILENATVQFDSDNTYLYKAEYLITPQGLDIQALADQGYSIQIDVSYEVYYVKDYDVMFDLGYMGAPDHDVHIVDAYEVGEIVENLPTATDPQAEHVSTVVAADLLKTPFFLKLLTYNMQNIVCFQNVVVNYTCMKS